MKLQARPYRDHTDMAHMRQLLMAGRQANISASYMHPGCLDWDTHRPPDEQANRRNLRLWERMDADQGQPTLEAWAIFSRHEATFDLFVSPALYDTPLHETVMDEYVAWAEARAREAGVKQISPFWAMDYDKVLARQMQARGFEMVPANPAAPLFEGTLDELPTIPLPAGFTVQGVSNLDEAAPKGGAAAQHGANLMRAAMQQMNLSARAYHRVLKLARTIADLAGEGEIQVAHLAEAIQYRPRVGL